ncbi:MAG: histidinol dehydrogenase, partial [Frankiales bacterium]|nr:histidinol dehydrogenase [Frankiales bacterium]
TAFAGQSAYVLVDDLEHGLEVVDAWAAEHLEMLTFDAPERARRVRNAGAVFVGNHTPVSLGDYLAGSNHVLPTGGTARFSAGLSTQTFLKRMSLVQYSADALVTVAPHVVALGGSEDLLAHVEAVQVRVRNTAR